MTKLKTLTAERNDFQERGLLVSLPLRRLHLSADNEFASRNEFLRAICTFRSASRNRSSSEVVLPLISSA